MLVQWIGDQSLVVGHIAKFSWMTVHMVKHEYRYLSRIKPRQLAMRENYPDVRLDINGNFRIH